MSKTSPKPSKRSLRRLLLVLLLVGVVAGVWVATRPPKNTARVTATVLLNGVPLEGWHISIHPVSVHRQIWGNVHIVGTTDKEGRCDLIFNRKSYDLMFKLRGIVASPLSSGWLWKRLFVKTATFSTAEVPIGKYRYEVAIRDENDSAVITDSFTFEVTPDAGKNHFVFDLTLGGKPWPPSPRPTDQRLSPIGRPLTSETTSAR